MKKLLVNIVILIILVSIFNVGNVQAVDASANANLSNLGIYKYDFRGFKPEITSYDTKVPNEVTKVTVYATTQNKGATYTVSGDTDLDVGINKITITVTSADKTTKKNII